MEGTHDGFALSCDLGQALPRLFVRKYRAVSQTQCGGTVNRHRTVALALRGLRPPVVPLPDHAPEITVRRTSC